MSTHFILDALLIGVFVLKVPFVMTLETILSFIVVPMMMIVSYAGTSA